MRIRDQSHLLQLLVILSCSNTRDAEASEHHALLCFSTKSSARGGTQVSFLRKSHSTFPLLYWSVWTANQQLEGCSISDEPAVAEHYLSMCHGERSGDFLEHSEVRFNVSLLLAPDSPCDLRTAVGLGSSRRRRRDLDQSHRVSSAPTTRRKRAWVFPGTLWCGTGSKAIDYEELGMFEPTDRCCREHDHCSSTIRAFSVNFGVFNSNVFTVSHCDCDRRFQQCLQGANDSISHTVGYSFFNVLKVPCFEFTQRRRCTKLNWWGMCTAVQVAPCAVFKNPTLYDGTRPAHDHVTVKPSATAIQDVTKPKQTKPTKPQNNCGPRGPTRGDTIWKGRRFGCSKARKQHLSPLTQRTTSQTTASSAGPASRTQRTKTTTHQGNMSSTQTTKFPKQRTTSKTPQTTIPRTQTTASQPLRTKSGKQRITPPKQRKQKQTSKTQTAASQPRTTTSQTLTTTYQIQTASFTPKSPQRPKPAKAQQRCGPIEPPRGDNFQPSRQKGKACLKAEVMIIPKETNRSSEQRTRSLKLRTTSQTETTMVLIKTTTSPAKTLVAPKLWTTSPNRTTTFPIRTDTPPTRTSTSSNKTTTSTTKMTKSPGLRARTVSPTKITISSTQKVKLLKMKVTSQTGVTTPPKKSTKSLKARITSQTKMNSSPKIASPTEMIISLKTKNASSTKRTTSPTKTITSPKTRTTSPTKMTTSPKAKILSLTHLSSKTFSQTLITTSSRTASQSQKPASSPKQRTGSLTKQRSSFSSWITTSTASKESHPAGNLLLCDNLRLLDDCKYKIPPLEMRYGYQNVESRTIYHCDCTHRLAGQLRHLKEANIIQSFLHDFVSLSCFVPSVKHCNNSTSCTAVLSKATSLVLALKKTEDQERSKAQNSEKAINRRTPVRLYKRCLRILNPRKPRLVKHAILKYGMVPKTDTQRASGYS